MVVRLSALVCTRDGEADLASCLRSLSFCDEVVVVLDRVGEREREAARRAGARIVDGIFPLFSQAQAAGLDLCTGEWILEVEPDERIDPALAWEIRAALQMRTDGDWFEIPIDNYVGDTLVRQGWTGALSIDRSARLGRRGVKSWRPGQRAGVELSGQTAGRLKGAIRRATGRDLGELLTRLERESGLAAQDLADGGRAGSLALALLAGLGAVLSSFIVRQGWREGRLGMIVAFLSGLHPVLTQMRAADLLSARAAEAARSRAHPMRRMAAG